MVDMNQCLYCIVYTILVYTLYTVYTYMYSILVYYSTQFLFHSYETTFNKWIRPSWTHMYIPLFHVNIWTFQNCFCPRELWKPHGLPPVFIFLVFYTVLVQCTRKYTVLYTVNDWLCRCLLSLTSRDIVSRDFRGLQMILKDRHVYFFKCTFSYSLLCRRSQIINIIILCQHCAHDTVITCQPVKMEILHHHMYIQYSI